MDARVEVGAVGDVRVAVAVGVVVDAVGGAVAVEVVEAVDQVSVAVGVERVAELSSAGVDRGIEGGAVGRVGVAVAVAVGDGGDAGDHVAAQGISGESSVGPARPALGVAVGGVIQDPGAPVVGGAVAEAGERLLEGDAGDAAVRPGGAGHQSGAVEGGAEGLGLDLELDAAAAEGAAGQGGDVEGGLSAATARGDRRRGGGLPGLGGGSQARRGAIGGVAQEDEGGAGVRAVVVVEHRPDDPVAVAVAVHVPGRGGEVAEDVARGVSHQDGVGGGAGDAGGETRGGAQEDKGGAGVRAVVVVGGGLDDEVRVAVAVDVRSRVHGLAELVAAAVAHQDRVSERAGVPAGDARRGAQEDEGRAGAGAVVVVLVGAHREVGVAVAVDVPCGDHGGGEAIAGAVPGDHRSGHRGHSAAGDARGRAQEDEGRP